MQELLIEAVNKQASDLHITVGAPPILRINGSLIRMQSDFLTAQNTKDLLNQITTKKQQESIESKGQLDFSYSINGLSRFRINAYSQRGSKSIAVRLIPEKIPSFEKLNLPKAIENLALKHRGLVIITGQSGTGKTTTLASIIDLINREKNHKIITLEDPVEFIHTHKQSIVEQREIYSDANSFNEALIAALRQDPNVIMVGEMRDRTTIETVVTAAETGHLVFATLHTGNSSQAISRIIDSFPPDQQQQIRAQLAVTLQGIISQQLIPRADKKGRVLATEVLLNNTAISNLIREGRENQILNTIQSSTNCGMQSMDRSLAELVNKGIIQTEEALNRAADKKVLEKYIIF